MIVNTMIGIFGHYKNTKCITIPTTSQDDIKHYQETYASNQYEYYIEQFDDIKLLNAKKSTYVFKNNIPLNM